MKPGCIKPRINAKRGAKFQNILKSKHFIQATSILLKILKYMCVVYTKRKQTKYM